MLGWRVSLEDPMPLHTRGRGWLLWARCILVVPRRQVSRRTHGLAQTCSWGESREHPASPVCPQMCAPHLHTHSQRPETRRGDDHHLVSPRHSCIWQGAWWIRALLWTSGQHRGKRREWSARVPQLPCLLLQPLREEALGRREAGRGTRGLYG